MGGRKGGEPPSFWQRWPSPKNYSCRWVLNPYQTTVTELVKCMYEPPFFLRPPPHPKNLSCGWVAKPIKTETMKSNVWTTPLENWGNILKRRVCPECWLLWGWDVTWLTGSVQPGPLGMRMNVQSDALNDENSSTCVGEWTDGDSYSYTVQMIGEVRRPLARLMDWHNSDHSNVQQEERAKCSNECKTNLVTTTECNQRVSTSIFNWYKKWFDTNPTVQLRA